MFTRPYEIKNAKIVVAHLDPSFDNGEDEFSYYVLFEVSKQEAADIISIQNEVSKGQFGKFLPVERINKVEGIWQVAANSKTRPKIEGVPNPHSKGLKLNLIKQADVKIEIWPYANRYGKGVGIELKEIIFNHQPQPTGDQKCL